MRKTWIILVLLGILPCLAFYALEWGGALDSLQYISKTNWQPGKPSTGDFAQMWLVIFTWAWMKGLLPVFIVSALPLFVTDIVRTLRRSKRTESLADELVDAVDK
jgi:hypothetical protein